MYSRVLSRIGSFVTSGVLASSENNHFRYRRPHIGWWRDLLFSHQLKGKRDIATPPQKIGDCNWDDWGKERIASEFRTGFLFPISVQKWKLFRSLNCFTIDLLSYSIISNLYLTVRNISRLLNAYCNCWICICSHNTFFPRSFSFRRWQSNAYEWHNVYVGAQFVS